MHLEAAGVAELVGAARRARRGCRARRARLHGAGDDLAGGLVAAHGVDGDGQAVGAHAVSRRRVSRRRWPGGRGTSRSCRTRRGAAWRRRSGGRRCAPARSRRPGRGPAAAALGLGGLLLGDGHRRSSVLVVRAIVRSRAAGGANGPTVAGDARRHEAGESYPVVARRVEAQVVEGRPAGVGAAARRGSSGGLAGGSSPRPRSGTRRGPGRGSRRAHSGASGRASSTASRTSGSRSIVVAGERVGLALGRVGLEDLADLGLGLAARPARGSAGTRPPTARVTVPVATDRAPRARGRLEHQRRRATGRRRAGRPRDGRRAPGRRRSASTARRASAGCPGAGSSSDDARACERRELGASRRRRPLGRASPVVDASSWSKKPSS